ncbi:helix-turn-helix transcriptional regulator [Nonomuraea sp. B12E4]|uniref:helix-turn-helix domain-containing protein n=1 Tax=Nonomuraea sp. B12E4 TaxID=3153564 RepID=UPI00325F0CFD
MPSSQRRLDPSVPRERFALELQDLHRAAGKPTQQVLATAMHCSHPTVSAILNGHRFPSLEQTRAFVKACRGEESEWRLKWIQADREINADGMLFTSETAIPESGVVRPAWYLDNEQFYLNAAERVSATRSRILVTYLRRRPPNHYTSDASAEYFEAVLDWARRPGARSVRRIIGISNRETRDWAHQHYQATKDIRNYDARVLRWELDADGINMALFDDATAFLAFSGVASQELSGFRVDSPEFLRYFVGHFDQLWACGTALEQYVSAQDDTRTL